SAFHLSFIVFTVIVLFIVYKNPDFTYALPLLIAYSIYITSILLYFIGATLWKIRYIPKSELSTRIKRFFSYFALFLLISFLLDLMIKHVPLYFYSIVTIPFAIAFGLVFFDLVFKKVTNKDM